MLGEPSREAEVYLIGLPISNIRRNSMQLVAMKIMPRKSFDDITKNANEIRITSQLSDLPGCLVRTGDGDGKGIGNCNAYFPKVIIADSCDNVILYHEGIHQEKARSSARVLDLIKDYPDKEDAIKILFNQGATAEQIAQRLSLQLRDGDTIYADILISELGYQDLNQWSFQAHSVDEWKAVIAQILDAIQFLHQIGHVIHNDLHLGNILLTPSGYVALHDFGKSQNIMYDITDGGHLERSCKDDINLVPDVINDYKTFLYYLSNPNNTQWIPEQIQQWARDNLQLIVQNPHEDYRSIINQLRNSLYTLGSSTLY